MSEEQQTLHGWIPDLADHAARIEALDKAFDYRGDVTLTLADGSVVTGYIFDRHTGPSLDDAHVRILPVDSDEKRLITYRDIVRLQFTGRDAAHGRSWETWIKKYVQKKSQGEAAEMEPMPLEDEY